MEIHWIESERGGEKESEGKDRYNTISEREKKLERHQKRQRARKKNSGDPSAGCYLSEI